MIYKDVWYRIFLSLKCWKNYLKSCRQGSGHQEALRTLPDWLKEFRVDQNKTSGSACEVLEHIWLIWAWDRIYYTQIETIIAKKLWCGRPKAHINPPTTRTEACVPPRGVCAQWKAPPVCIGWQKPRFPMFAGWDRISCHGILHNYGKKIAAPRNLEDSKVGGGQVWKPVFSRIF